MAENTGEGMNRRGFFKKVATASLGVATALDAAFSTRLKRPTYEVTPQAQELISKAAKDMVYGIEYSDVPISATHEGKEVTLKAEFNPGVIAQTIATLSYLDGGSTELEAVKKFLLERRLSIGSGLQGTEFDGMYQPSLRVNVDNNTFNTSARILINPDVMARYYKEQPHPTNEYVARHELWHFIQQARDPQSYEKLILAEPLSVIGSVAMASGIGAHEALSFGEKVLKLNRRNFLQKTAHVGVSVLGMGMGIPIGTYLENIISPKEAQAYLQIGLSNFKGLMNQKALDPLRGNLITFKPQ